MRSLIAFLVATMVIQAQEPKPDLANKPPYERMLKGDNLKKAEELETKIDELESAGKREEAGKVAEELLALRKKLQGNDHWEVADAQGRLTDLKKQRSQEQVQQLFEARSQNQKADELDQKGKYAEAEPLYQKSLAIRRKVLGEEHTETANSYNNLAFILNAQVKSAEAEPHFQKALAIRRKVLGEEHPDTALSYYYLAGNLAAQGKSAEAEPLFQKALVINRKVLGEDHSSTAASYNGVAVNLEALGKFAEAEPLFQKALEINRKVLGEEHRNTAVSYYGVAKIFKALGKSTEAEPYYQKALLINRNVLGEEHPSTASIYNGFAVNLEVLGKFAAAEPLHQKALAINLKVLGEEHPKTSTSYNNLAINLDAQGKSAEAEPLYQKALAINRKVLGEEHPDTALSYNNLAGNLAAQGKSAEAEPLFQKALAIRRKVHGEEHPRTAESYNNLASNLNSQSKYIEAEPLYQKALEIRRKVLGEEHPRTADSYNNVAQNLNAQGKFTESEPLFQKALDICQKVLGEEHPDTAQSYNNFAVNLESQGKSAEAEPLFLKALAINLKVFGEEHPRTANSYSNVAFNLNSQSKYIDAEPLYQKALAIHRKVLGEVHPSTALSYDSLAITHHALGQTEQAAESLRQSLHSYDTSRQTVANGMDRALNGESNPRPLLAVLQAVKQPEASWVLLEASLARNLLDEQASRSGNQLSTPEQAREAAIHQQRNAVQSQILVLVSKQKHSAEEQSRLDQLLAERRNLEERLAQFATLLSRRLVATPEAIRATLPNDAAMLMWVDVSDFTGKVQEHWACVVRSTGEPRWVKLPGSSDQGKWTFVDSNLPGQLRDALRAKVPPADLNVLIQKLQAQRIAPVLPHLDGVKTLYVVGVDKMAGIPVEVLAPQFTVSYIPSGTYLARLKDQPASAGNRLLALGDPIFKTLKEEIATPKRTPPTSGVYITTVVPGGAAAKAKLLAGDVILKYGTTELKSFDDLKAALAANATTKEVPIVVWRETADKDLERTVPRGKLGVTFDTGSAGEAIASRRKTDEMFAKLRGGNWGELPGTKVEVTGLAKLVPDAKVFVNGEASEANLEALRKAGELGKYRYLHFATHGEGNNVKAFESTLILAQNNLPKELMPQPGEPFHDGKLSAREVLDYWKLNADLVTLSACETAIGKSGGGDGLLGFAQAFLLAGSRSVCLSLWKVDDCATALLMQRFYANLITRKMGKAAALHDAKKWLRGLSADDAAKLAASISNGVARGDRGPTKDFKPVPEAKVELKVPSQDTKPFANPRYWAAFILIGDPN